LIVSVVVVPAPAVTDHVNRATGLSVPVTGGLGSAHDVVSLSETSGPLTACASVMKYVAASCASLDFPRRCFVESCAWTNK